MKTNIRKNDTISLPMSTKSYKGIEQYDAVESWCREAVSSGCDFLFDQTKFHAAVARASGELDIPLEALHSFLRNTHLIHVKKTTHRIRESIRRHLEAYCAGTSILGIAKAEKFPSYLLARLLVEHLTAQQSKKSVTEAMRDPRGRLGDKQAVAEKYLESEQFVRDDLQEERDSGRHLTRLSLEVVEAINSDPMYGPQHDRERNVIGTEYELLLEQTLHKMDIPFETELELRERGTARTPDVLLVCPLGIKLPKKDGNGMEWKVVCWIDSKALFGDVNTHHTSVLPQAETYVHRFGPGLVIYWFGHAPLDRLHDSHGDVAIVGWEVPKAMMWPTGELVFREHST